MVTMSSEAEHPESAQFQPERTHLLAALLMIGIAMLVIGVAPLYLFWILVFPILFIVWVLRARTVVDGSGIRIRYAFRGSRHIVWDDLSGVGFRGSRALATTTGGREFLLPGVTFNSLPRLSKASQGRIPDVLTAGRAAADDKVVVIHRDGEQVLITKEEYAARQAAQRAEESAEEDPTNDSPRSK
ncbi:PH domain-containing protein [Corynebacterium halotolerans]|uniref:Low molecular weight protein antigen 6 PH domain-containing protein n=1 Tax=Corynebacterium halotolerans YIM 70093 = DSM 44683 TaxID=1121362 RepID=M1NS33_9CORY|nr:hypothetical protein A605_06455 [Corynebacterium halotolerans YIM 70093 = DSM 44683]